MKSKQEEKLRKEIDKIFDDCYSRDLSACPLHTIFQRGKAINKLLPLFKQLLGGSLMDNKNAPKEDEVLLAGIAKAPIVTTVGIDAHTAQDIQCTADHIYYLTKAREAVEGAGLTEEEIDNIENEYPRKFGVGITVRDVQLHAILKAMGGE